MTEHARLETDRTDAEQAIETAWRSALACHRAGYLHKADALYVAILNAVPSHADAHYNLGLLRAQAGQYETSLSSLLAAIDADPTVGDYWLSYIEVLSLTGQHAQARDVLAQARVHGLQGAKVDALASQLSAAPTQSGAATPSKQEVATLATLLQRDQYAEAELLAHEMTRRFPSFGYGWKALASIHEATLRYKDAERCYRQIIAIEPNLAAAHFNLGVIAARESRPATAMDHYSAALRIDPAYVDAHINLGSIYKRIGRYIDAEMSFRSAIQFNAESASAHYNLGGVLLLQNRFAEAEQALRRAAALQPTAAAYCNLGVTLVKQERFAEAEAAYRRAIELAPEYVEAHSNLAGLLADQCKLADAIASYRQAQRLEPQAWQHAVNAELLLPAVYDSAASVQGWRDRYRAGIETLRRTPGQLDEPASKLGSVSFLLAYQHRSDKAELQALCALFRERIPSLNYVAPHIATWQPPTGRIRVAIVSEYLCSHTIGRLYRGLIRGLNRDSFEVVAVHLPGSKHDSQRAQIDASADRVISLPLSLAAQQAVMSEQRFDIVLYPDIGMSPATYFLAYARLAPVQLTSFGHPDTSGLDTIDYFLSGESIEGDGAEEQYRERLLRLKQIPCVYDTAPLPTLIDRHSLGLPSGTLYGCPQSLFKFHPDFDAVLASIVSKDPSAHIVAVEAINPAWTAALRSRWSTTAPALLDKVIFVSRLPVEQFLSLLNAVDVLLDPLYFGSGNTVYEAMMVGTPVVTWPGEFMRGRIVAGVYRQLGVADAPIAKSSDEYVRLAVQFGTDAQRRDSLRQSLKIAAREKLFDDRVALLEIESVLKSTIAAASRGERIADLHA